MIKIYYLTTCSTCSRILKELALCGPFDLQNIKTEKITESQLEEMKERSGSFETLFSRKAMKYRELGLQEKSLTEKDYKKLILEEYTFLKRPVIVTDKNIFIGNAKSSVEAAKKELCK